MSEQIQAGPELDAEVARVVFGWRRMEPKNPTHLRCFAGKFGWVLMPPGQDHYGQWKPAEPGTPPAPDWLDVLAEEETVPPYSTDIAAAWLVVERLREIGLGVLIATERSGWEVELTTTPALYERGYRGCFRTDPTMPLVVCRAALVAFAEARP